MFNVRLAGGYLYGKQLFTWLSLVVSLMASFCAVLFPTRCLGWDLGLNWVSFWGISYLPLNLCQNPHLVTWSLYEMFSNYRYHIISRLFFSLENICDLQAIRNMDITRKRISFTFDPWDMFYLSILASFYVKAAVNYALFERNSGFKLASETLGPRYLKLLTVQSFYL